MGHSWEGITSLDPWVTHGKILRSLHLRKMVIESQNQLESLTPGKILR